MGYGASPLVHTVGVEISATSITTPAIDTTGADLIVIAVSDYIAAPISAISDSKSNTWTKLASSSTSVTRNTLYYCQNPTVGSGHTFTASGGGNAVYPGIAVQAWAGSTSAPFDQQNGATVDPGTTLNTGSITPGFANELVIASVGGNSGTEVWSIGSSFTISDQTPAVGGSGIGIGMAYLVQGSATAVNPQWTSSTSTDMAARIASFKAAAAAGGCIPSLALMGVGKCAAPIAGLEWLRHRKNRIRRDGYKARESGICVPEDYDEEAA